MLPSRVRLYRPLPCRVYGTCATVQALPLAGVPVMLPAPVLISALKLAPPLICTVAPLATVPPKLACTNAASLVATTLRSSAALAR